ncbi:MAG TPA: NAD(P)-dependent oxidoreductase [Actinomycetota bacterium]|nr:NAD(P)-dependent oxidoreductase [Actinomycetota bacterium]
MTRVAVLGAGNMAGAMVGTLRRADIDVSVWNRTRSRGESVAETHGATTADTRAGAIEGADVVLSSLADDTAVLETYLGDDGAAAACASGQVVLEMSTIAPSTVLRVGEAVAATGAAFLDAPVSGSVPTVEKGELTVMVGGDAGALERARPVLDALAAKVFHVGALGAGATVKLAVNALVHAIDIGLSEALVLAEKAGVDRSAAYDVFAAGAAAAPFVLYKRPAFEDPDAAPLTFTLDLMGKDLELILSLAREVEAPMGQAERNKELVDRALAAGFSGRDMSSVAEYLRRASSLNASSS